MPYLAHAGKMRLIKRLHLYPWSGHAVLMGKNDLAGQVVDGLLFFFGRRLSASRHKYRQFVADGISQGRRPELVGGGLRRSRKASGDQDDCANFDDRVLGSGEFIDRLRRETAARSIPAPRCRYSMYASISANCLKWRRKSFPGGRKMGRPPRPGRCSATRRSVCLA